jgi:xylulokinase
LYDIRSQCWDHRFGEAVVGEQRLPTIAWTTEVAGEITEEAAQATGLPVGLPVIVGTTDASAEAISVGVIRPGRLMLMYGSTAFMILVTEEQKCDQRLWAAPYLFPNTFALMAGMATSGSLTRWFRDNFAPDLIDDETASGVNPYQALALEAAKVAAGSEGLVILPYFSGERTPINDPRARGVIFGLNLAHTRGHLYRAVLEAVGYGIRHHLEVFREIEAEVESVHAVGGGTRNSLWLEIVSDICAQSQQVHSVSLGASYGDAFLAGCGVGLFSSSESILDWNRPDRIITPDASNARQYERSYQLFRQLYIQTKDLMRETARVVTGD